MRSKTNPPNDNEIQEELNLLKLIQELKTCNLHEELGCNSMTEKAKSLKDKFNSKEKLSSNCLADDVDLIKFDFRSKELCFPEMGASEDEFFKELCKDAKLKVGHCSSESEKQRKIARDSRLCIFKIKELWQNSQLPKDVKIQKYNQNFPWVENDPEFDLDFNSCDPYLKAHGDLIKLEKQKLNQGDNFDTEKCVWATGTKPRIVTLPNPSDCQIEGNPKTISICTGYVVCPKKVKADDDELQGNFVRRSTCSPENCGADSAVDCTKERGYFSTRAKSEVGSVLSGDALTGILPQQQKAPEVVPPAAEGAEPPPASPSP